MKLFGLFRVVLDERIPKNRILIGNSLVPTQGTAPIQENTLVDVTTIYPSDGLNKYDDIYTVRLREYLTNELW